MSRGTMRPAARISGRAILSAMLAMVTCAVIAQVSDAATVNLDAATPAVHIGWDPAGVNNAVPLANSAGPVLVKASGNSRFGSRTGEQYNAALVAYRDQLGHAQYASIPMNSPLGAVIDGSKYDYVMLTDTAGLNVGNTGTTDITQTTLLGDPLAGGTIYAGSTTSAQTGVAQLVSGGNAAFFNTLPVGVPQAFQISVTGEAFFGPGAQDKYGSVIVQYRDPTNGMTYDALPVGQTRNYFGFNFRVYLTDFADDLADNHGVLTVNGQVPEPGMGMMVVAMSAGAAIVRRRRRITNCR